MILVLKGDLTGGVEARAACDRARGCRSTWIALERVTVRIGYTCRIIKPNPQSGANLSSPVGEMFEFESLRPKVRASNETA
jgi:hypothetical protein